MEISDKGLALIKQFEGCVLKAYQDRVGVWTIGYGWTQPVNGQKVGPGMDITKPMAEYLLRRGIAQYELGVILMLNVNINQNQFDALVCFSYNIGVKALQDSTLLRKLNVGDYQGAADEFPLWVNASGKPLRGLVKLREAERELFLK